MGGSGGDQTQTTQQQLPPELSSWAGKYLNTLGQLILPGGQITQSPLPYQQVAPMTPQQLQGMQLVSNETYGPSGAPNAGPAPTQQQLMAGMTASPYWQNQMQQNPYTQGAFSPLALSQLSQLWTGL